MQKTAKQRSIIYILLLIVAHTIFHFIPPERQSIAPDNYAFLVTTRHNSSFKPLDYFIKFPHRPINHMVLDLQGKLCNDNPVLGFLLVFSSSLFILLAVFLLLRELFNNTFASFISTLLYCAMPNKLETYHNTIFFNMNVAIGLYIISFLFFLLYLKKNKLFYFFVSFIVYGFVIFWYELGFFLPVALLAYCLLFQRAKGPKVALVFILPSIIYIITRITVFFGLGDKTSYTHSIGPSGIGTTAIDLLHNFAGRYMARSIIYGFYKFFSIEKFWLIAIIVLDAVFLISLWVYLVKQKEIAGVNRRLMVFSWVIILTFTIPNFLNAGGGFAGRQLSLLLIGVVITLFWLIKKTGRYWKTLLLFILAFSLIVCQGNAWVQVVACRINARIYSKIKEKREELRKASHIVFDSRSFADKIPFTFIKRDFNVLNTYYGAQTLEDWGLRSMVHLALNDQSKPAFVATEPLIFKKDGYLEFAVSDYKGYRSVEKRKIVLPAEGTIIIDFNAVYPDGFKETP